jgi:hypothetical protein
MGRHKQYADAAERAREYRRRQAAHEHQAAATAGGIPVSKQRRPPSRPARIAALESAAQALHDEYESWLSAMPEAMQGGSVVEKLTATVETLSTILELIQSLDPPRGFGRD